MVELTIHWCGMVKQIFIVVTVLALTSIHWNGFAQEVLENAPPSIDWRQLITPHFKIIYSSDFENNAQQLANRLEALYQPASEQLDAPPKRIPIILQNQNSVSNGFVTLSPRRSEFYTMPPQDYNFLGTNTWLDLLAVHEFQHVVQFEKSKTGFTKIARLLFGQNAQAGLAVISVPGWFWEGDATLTETLFTKSGRGRMPDFNRIYRTNLLSKKRYSYNKQHLQSYKDYIPNEYVLGYNYVTHLRRKTNDPKIWEKVTESSFSWPFIPFTFSNSLKRYTGKNIRHNYREMQTELEQLWQEQEEALDPEDYQVLIEEPKVFTNYHYPQLLSDGNIVVMKTGLGDADHFVVLNEDGEEVRRYMMGPFSDAAFLSMAQDRLVWNEIFVDERYSKRSSSVIKVRDFKERFTRTLTRNSRYTGAAISPDGLKILTSLTTEDQQHYLIVIDFYSGEEIRRYSTSDNSYLSMARFSEDGSRIVSLMNNQQGKGVVAFDYETGEMETLIPVGNENIGHPVLLKDYLLYNSPWNGLDNIFAKDLASDQRYMITNSRYGAYNPVVDSTGQVMYFNNHKPMGMNVAKLPFDPSSWIPIEEAPVSRVDYYEPLIDYKNLNKLKNSVEKVYETKNYHSLLNIINPHSWGPLATSDLNTVEVGIYSKDILNTTRLSAGYEYNINDRSGVYFGEVSYQGLFPIIDLRVESGERRDQLSYTDLAWNENSYEIGTRIPLNLTRTRFYSRLEAGYNIGIREVKNLSSTFQAPLFDIDRIFPYQDTDSTVGLLPYLLEEGTLSYNEFTLSYYLLQKQSIRDINSRWGAVIDVESFSTNEFFNNKYEGGLFAVRSTFYLPSPVFLLKRDWFKHHSLFFRINYQERKNDPLENLYYFPNRIFLPRGYLHYNYSDFTTFSANYKLPLLYPDLSLGPFLYLKRVKLNAFFDYGQGTNTIYGFIMRNDGNIYIGTGENYYTYKSVGSELTFDINVMRFPVNIDLGVRFAYTLDTQQTTFDFLLVNIDF